MSILARRITPNVAIPSGDLYPNGVDISPANPDIQATVRPAGWMFRPSAGYETIRVGRHNLDIAHPSGGGIHFTPITLAENLSMQATPGGPPAMVSPRAGIADVADIPGSEFLDDEGKLPGYLAAQNRGVYLEDDTRPPAPGTTPQSGGTTIRDMGDRSPFRPMTRAFYGLTQNPAGMLRQEWADNPMVALLWGGAILGVIYMFSDNVERAFRSRRGRGLAATAGAAPAAAAAGTGKTVSETAEAANKTLTAAGEAVEKAVSAAGDAVEAAGEAVEKTGEAAADAVKE